MIAERKWGFDFIRAAAATLVFIAHLTVWRDLDLRLPVSSAIVATNFGFLGVQLFFALSGYLTGGILLRQQPDNVRDIGIFWLRRLLRTMPLFIVVLTLLYSYEHPRNSYLTYLFQLAWLPGYISSEDNSFFIVSWSLAIEEWYYFFIPPIFCLFAFRLKIQPLIVAASIVVVLTILRYSLLDSVPDYLVRLTTPISLDSIAWGLLAATMRPSPKFREYFFWTGIFLITVALTWRFGEIYHQWKQSGRISLALEQFNFWGYIIVSAGCGLILPKIGDIIVRNNFAYRCVTKIALISYPIYLTHFNIINVMKDNISILESSIYGIYISCAVQIFSAVLITFLGAQLLHWAIEKPFMRIGKLLQDRRRQSELMPMGFRL